MLPWPVWPLAGQCSLGQNMVVGSMMVLLALCGSMPRGVGSVTKRLLFLWSCYAPPAEEPWRELCIMDYELRIVVEKVAVSSQEVVKRDTIISYALQRPTSILELGLRHGEQIA